MVAEEKDDRRYDRRRDYKSESKSDRRPSYHAAIYESDGESMARKLRKLLREDAKAERGDGIRKARETALLSPRFAASRARARVARRRARARLSTDALSPSLPSPRAPARQVFDQIDANGDGRISGIEFRRACRQYGFNLSDREIQELIRRFDVDGDGTISYLEFESFVEANEMKDSELENVVPRLRDIIARQHGSSGRALMRAFEDFDVDDSGEIDKDEFHEGLAKFGLTMTLHEADLILKRFVGRRANHVLYRDFVRMIEDRSTYVTDGGRTRYRVDEAAVIKVRRALRGLSETIYGDEYWRVFEEFDVNGDKSISRSEFRRGMEQLDLRLSSSEIKDVIDVFDADGDGEISYQEFVAFCREEDTETKRLLDRVRSEFVRLADAGPYASRTGVPSMRPVFQEFDRSHRGCITRHEFKQGVQLLGLKLSQREVEQVLQHLDADGNGEISYIEFETFVDERGSYDDRGSKK